MEVINVTIDTFRNEIIGRTFLFEDDKSISIDTTNNIIDSDGLPTIPESRIRKIKEQFNIDIK